MLNKVNKKDVADSVTKQQLANLDKKIESVELEKKETNKEKKQLSAKIRNLKTQLGLIYKEESVIESKVAEIETQEKKVSPSQKEQIEKKRWKADTERREIEKKKWQILEEIKKQEKQIKEINLRHQQVLRKKEQLEKEREEIFQERKRELLQEKAGFKNDFFQLEDKKKSVDSRKNELLVQKDRTETQLENILEKEKNTEDILEKIEAKEREISDPEEKKEIEKERWRVEDDRKKLEKQRWELEKEKKRLPSLFKEIEAEYQEILTKENLLKEKVKTINLELGLPYVEEEEFREKEILSKEGELKEEPEKEKLPPEEKPELPGPPEEKKPPELEEAIRKWKEKERLQLEEEIRKWEKRERLQRKVQPQKKEREEKKQREQEYRAIFKKSLNSYKKGEFSVAKELLNKVIVVEEIREKKPAGFLARIIRIIRSASLQEKARDLLKKIKKQEEKAQAKRQKAEELKRKEKEGVKKREETERYQEELIKKHNEELKTQKEEITRKYQEEWERQRNELLKKQKEFKEGKQKLREEAMEEAIRREKMREQEKELEKKKAEIQERYEQEFQRIKEELQEQHVKELKVLRVEEIKKMQEGLKEKEEELKNKEEETEKMRETPEETLTEEERTKREEAILKAEEEVREKRGMIEEEVKKIEQEEIKRKQLEEKFKGGEPQKRIEVTEAEIEKRRTQLQEAIRKEKEMMAPEEMEREQKEKAATLNTLFKEAIFHYKEKNLDKAIEIFQELKEKLPEPQKEPGFFSRIFGKVPLYIQIEDYISKIKKEKILEEKRKIREIREDVRIAAEEKQKAKYQFFFKLKKKISKWLPASPLVIFRKFLFLPPLVAIDISDYSIELLRLNKKLSVLAYGRSIIKEGVIYEGKIKNPKELSLAFKLAVNQAGFKSFRPRQGPILRGIVSIPEYKTNVQTFTFESRDNIFEKVKEEIKKTIPFPIDELYWDYLEDWDEKSNKTKVLSVAVLKDIIDEQIYFLKSSGVEPVVFDFEAASIGRALLPEKVVPDKASILILDIGARVTNMNIFDETGFINSSTAIPSAGHYLVDKIAENFGVSREEAETIMNIKGFYKEDNIILGVLEKEMEKIVEETRGAIEYYQKKTGNKIKKIILSGGTALFPEIDKFFQSRFQNIEIEIGDPLKKIKRRGGIDPSKAVLYTNSIGLALRSILKDPIGGGINLLPGKIKEKEKKVYWQRHRQKLIIIRTILVILIVAAALLIYLYIEDFLKLF